MSHTPTDHANTASRRLVSVFKSRRKEEMYLFVDKKAGLSQLPDSLLTLFGKPEPVLDMLLSANRKLARVTASEVLQSIEAKGYFLQLPPPPEALTAVAKAREMMPAKGRAGHE